MIAIVSGIIKHIGTNYCIIKTNDLGYKIFCTNDTLRTLKENENTTLWTHLAVREDSHTLFGFPEKNELDFFELLITVSGVGPRSALNIIGIADSKATRSAIAHGDVTYLIKIGGIGKKTAEKLIIELKDKMTPEDVFGENDSEVIDALVSMGYTLRDARLATQNIAIGIKGTSARLKAVLKSVKV